MTLLEREQQALAAAPSHDELVLRLRAVVKEALVAGTPRDQIMSALEELTEHDASHHDVVLDVMDFIVGWSSPHVALPHATR